MENGIAFPLYKQWKYNACMLNLENYTEFIRLSHSSLYCWVIDMNKFICFSK